MVKHFITDELTSKLKPFCKSSPEIAPVLALEAGGHNMIPLMAAHVLAVALGLRVNVEIGQNRKAFRGAKSALGRIFSPSGFRGEVTQGKSYLLLDDALTQGGTFAAMADFILQRGTKSSGHSR